MGSRVESEMSLDSTKSYESLDVTVHGDSPAMQGRNNGRFPYLKMLDFDK